MARPFVVVTRRLPERVEAALAERFEVELNSRDEPRSTAWLHDAMSRADAVLCTAVDRMSAEAIGTAPRAKMLANFAVGVNHIDLDACRAAGVSVSNTPGVLTEATADIALALTLMAARRCGEGERMLRAGLWTGWAPTQLLGVDLTGRTLGIVGMGRIGRATARKARDAFGMEVIYANRSEVDPEMPARRVELPELMETADVVSVHAPGGAANRGLISAELIARMKPTAILVNTARGDVIDEPALAAALEARRIFAAGLDVYAEEPRVPESLMRLENVVLLPHMGSGTVATREAMGMKCVANLDAFFAGRELPDRVV